MDSARFDQTANSGYYFINSEEGIWESGKEGINSGYKPRHKEGYFPVPPTDSQQDIRSEMILEMEKAGIVIEKHNHEVATAGQAEIDMRFDSLVTMADKVMLYKYICKNVAKRHGKTVTFMPKPIFGDNGSGMHTHQSIWKDGKPLFAGNEYAGISKMCLYYIGGILKHAHALAAFTNPTTNSYKRLTPGFEGASEPGLFQPEPKRLYPDPDVFSQPEGEADRGAIPGSGLQSLPGLCGDAHGRY